MVEKTSFAPTSPTPDGSLKELARGVDNKFRQIAKSDATRQFLQIQVSHAEPTRPRDGMIAYADGSDWDPSGAGTDGFFGYENGAWVKL